MDPTVLNVIETVGGARKLFLIDDVGGIYYRKNTEDDFSLLSLWEDIDYYDADDNRMFFISKGIYVKFPTKHTIAQRESNPIEPPTKFQPPELGITSFSQAVENVGNLEVFDADAFVALSNAINDGESFHKEMKTFEAQLNCDFACGYHVRRTEAIMSYLWGYANTDAPKQQNEQTDSIALKYAAFIKETIKKAEEGDRDAKSHIEANLEGVNDGGTKVSANFLFALCQEIERRINYRENPDSIEALSCRYSTKIHAEVPHEDMEEFLHDEYLPRVAKEPRKRREIIVCSDTLGEHVRKDEIFVFRAQDLKDCGVFKFPGGYPQDGNTYILHPFLDDTYLELNAFHSNLLEKKYDELIYLLVSLGASSVQADVIHSTDVSREESSRVSGQGEASYKVVSASGGGSLAKEKQERGSYYQRFSSNRKLRPKGKPFIPDDLLFFEKEDGWKRMAKQALEGRYESLDVTLEYKSEYGVDEKRVSNLNAKVKSIVAGVEVGFDTESKKKLQEAKSTVWKYSVRFDPPATDAEVMAPAEPLPLLPAVEAKGLTEAEQTYIETVKDALADGAITPATRKILERTRTRLGVSPERAGELEQSLAAPALSPEEQAYYEEVKDALADGEIAGFARRTLDKRQKELGLTPEQAKAIEASLQGNP